MKPITGTAHQKGPYGQNEVDWLTYKHGTLNPMARLGKVISDNLQDITHLCRYGPYQQIVHHEDGSKTKVTITVEKET